MRNTFLTLLAVLFVASICFAQEGSVLSSTDNSSNPTQASSNTAVTQPSGDIPSPTPVKRSIFNGKVDFVYSGDGMSGANPQITIKDDKELDTTFIVANDATIIGKDGNKTTLTWIQKNDKVKIEYITSKDGATKTAKAIKALAN